MILPDHYVPVLICHAGADGEKAKEVATRPSSKVAISMQLETLDMSCQVRRRNLHVLRKLLLDLFESFEPIAVGQVA